LIELLTTSFKVIEKMVGLVPTIKKSYYRKKFHSLHKKILFELKKEDHEKLDSVIDDLFDDYRLLLKHFSEEAKS
tara:strand:- start:1 stop:225 length:225 start_codon:yes stop_codon:yes gene_type:complete